MPLGERSVVEGEVLNVRPVVLDPRQRAQGTEQPAISNRTLRTKCVGTYQARVGEDSREESRWR